jgi:hypothetical protein
MKRLVFLLAALAFASPAYASSSSVLLVGNNTGGVVNGVQILGATTGNTPVLSSQGSDTNVGFIFTTQGTGALNLETAGSGNVILAPGSGSVVIPAFTTSGIVFNNASGVLSSGTALPNGTTATTQSSGDNSTKVATTAYVDAATGGGSSGMVLLATVNASGASSVVFNSTYITTTYNKYVIEFDGAYTSDAGALYLTVSTNNGSSYLSSNYNWGVWSMGSGPYSNNASSQNQIDLTGNAGFGSTSSTSTKISSGTIKLSNLAQSVQANVIWEIFFGGAASPQNSGIGGIGFNTTTTAINAIKITDGSSGTITGNFHLYGLKGT